MLAKPWNEYRVRHLLYLKVYAGPFYEGLEPLALNLAKTIKGANIRIYQSVNFPTQWRDTSNLWTYNYLRYKSLRRP